MWPHGKITKYWLHCLVGTLPTVEEKKTPPWLCQSSFLRLTDVAFWKHKLNTWFVPPFIISLHSHEQVYLQLILIFNLRGEPVLFVRDGFDMVPYSPRPRDQLSSCVTGETDSPQQCTELECQLRKEVRFQVASWKGFCCWGNPQMLCLKAVANAEIISLFRLKNKKTWNEKHMRM